MIAQPKYRFILGKIVDTSVNLVTNGTFMGSATGWTLGASWSYASNEARYTYGGGFTYVAEAISQLGIVSPGTTYWLSYKMRKQSGTDATITPSVGGLYYDWVNTYDTNTSTSYATFVHENMFCHHGNDLVFYGRLNEPAAIDDIVLYPYVWNDPLIAEPINWDKATITKKRDTVLNGLIHNYIADLVFIDDGYDYLRALYLSNNISGEVPVRIEVLDSTSGIYQKFYEGIIFINDLDFDLTNKEVKATITDSNASQIFIKAKDVKVSVNQQLLNPAVIIDYSSAFPLDAPNPLKNIYLNDDTGAYPGAATCNRDFGFLVYNLLRRITMLSTNYRLDLDSAFFGSGGAFEGLCISTGLIFTGLNPNLNLQLSMRELLSELNKLFNLSFSIDNSGSIPKVIIEPTVDYYNLTPVLSLSKVNNLSVTADKNSLVRVINSGYEYIDETPTETGKNDPKGNQYYTDNIYADKELNLVSRFIQNSTVIKNLSIYITAPTITGNKYDKTWIWIETDATLDASCATTAFKGFRTLNSGSGTYDLNPNITEALNVSRQIATLPTSYLKPAIDGNEVITRAGLIYLNVYSFNYPLTKAQFDLISQAYDSIEFNMDGTGVTTNKGFLIEGDYNIKTGLTEFKLLSS